MQKTTVATISQHLQNKFGSVITTSELSQELKLSEITLKMQRAEGTGIPYIKVGRLVRYTPEDVASYLISQKIIMA